MHIRFQILVCICIMTRCTKNIVHPNHQSCRKSVVLNFAAILSHFHASYFNNENVSKSFASVIHQIPHTCRGCHPEYVYASVLCHIDSVTHWTQEVRHTQSDLHDIYCLFYTHHTLQHVIQITDERALLTALQPKVRGVRVHSLLLAALITFIN